MPSNNNNRLEVRLPDGSQKELDRIAAATGHDVATITKNAIHHYLHYLIDIGEVPAKNEVDVEDVGYAFLEKYFGINVKSKHTSDL